MFEPPYKWIVSFDEGVYSFEVFATTIDVRAVVASKEPQKARLAWAKLDQWRSFDNLTRSSVPVMARLREFEFEFPHQTEAEERNRQRRKIMTKKMRAVNTGLAMTLARNPPR